MNWKKFVITFVVVLVVTTMGSFVIHAMLLQPDYQQNQHLLRTEEDAAAYFPYMILNFFAFSLAFTWIYAQGVEDKPWLGQGIRFGLAVWLLKSVSGFLTYYAVQPWPAETVLRQIGFELPWMLVLGLAAAALYRK